jgi:hypothetical protein
VSFDGLASRAIPQIVLPRSWLAPQKREERKEARRKRNFVKGSRPTRARASVYFLYFNPLAFCLRPGVSLQNLPLQAKGVL